MYIIQKHANTNGSRPPLQEWPSYVEGATPPNEFLWCSDEYFSIFYDRTKQCAGFVNIVDDGENVTSMSWNEEDYKKFVATLPDPVISAKQNKIDNMSKECEKNIFSGTDVKLGEETKHFSYGLVDQSNISEMLVAVMGGATEYPYHADGEECRVYTAQEIVTIYMTLSLFKTGHITYNNQLKQYIKTLTKVDEVDKIVYGQELTGEYLTKYNQLMAEAKVQVESIVTKMSL